MPLRNSNLKSKRCDFRYDPHDRVAILGSLRADSITNGATDVCNGCNGLQAMFMNGNGRITHVAPHEMTFHGGNAVVRSDGGQGVTFERNTKFENATIFYCGVSRFHMHRKRRAI